VIVTTPRKDFDLPAVSNPPTGDVQPTGVDLTLDPGASATPTVAITLPSNLVPTDPNPPPPHDVGVFHVGDVFASITSAGNGYVYQYTPDGALLNTMNTGTANSTTGTTGMAFDGASNLYVTSFGQSAIHRFDANAQPTTPDPFVMDDPNSHNESIVFDAAGNFYVGQPDGTAAILKRAADGTLLASYQVASEDRGSDWVDLASDQHTLYYTSEGSTVFRFDTSTNTQLPDFATGLPGSHAYALRILPDGGVLVADTETIVRLDANGNIVQTYNVPGEQGWFSLNLDPDGTSFWSGDYITGNVYEFSIATGTVERTFNTLPLNGLDGIFGLGVFGEPTAALAVPRIPVEVISSDPSIAFVNQSGTVGGVAGGQVSFQVQITGDGAAHDFDLLFVRTDTGAVLGSIPVTLNDHYAYTVHAIDPDNDPVTYSMLAGPAGASVDPQTGVLDWEPTQAGTYHFSLEAADGRGGYDTQSYDVVVTVGAPNQIPTITSTAPTSAMANSTYTYSVVANDADQDPLTYFLVPTQGQAPPAGMVIDRNTGIITWTPTTSQEGPQTATVEVLDGHGGQAKQTFTVTVSPPAFVNYPPHIFTPAIIVATAGQHYIYPADASDVDADVLTWDLPVKPAGMSVDPHTGIVVWTPTMDQVGSQPVLLRVTDAHGATDLQPFNVTVSAPNEIPVITSTAPAKATADEPYQYTVIAQDSDNDALTYHLDSTPIDNMALDPNTGVFTWTPTDAEAGSTVTVTLHVDDGRGGTAPQTIKIQVAPAAAPNQNPAITSTPRTTIQIGQRYVYLVVASDADGDPLTYSLPVHPTGMSMTAAGAVTWTPTQDQFGPHAVEVRVDDGRGGFDVKDFTVNVVTTQTNDPPEITSSPPLVATVGQLYAYNMTGDDPDGDVLDWHLVGGPVGMSLDPLLGTLRWTPTPDQVGHQDVHVQLVDSAGSAVP
jgi:Putative Ig domain/Bacterial Ig domain